jgi:hypothetical protein
MGDLERTNGEWRQRLVSGESEMDNAVSGLRRGGDTVGGRPMSETPGAEASGESEVLQDPST